MKQPTPLMLHTLKEIGDSTTTGFGYNYNPNGKRNLNINTVHACIKRGLLEPAGEEFWSGQKTPVYRVSEAGKEAQRPTIYPDLESAQAAMDRGETVRIEMEPFTIDPALVQLAIDLQHKERFEQWKAQESVQ